MLMEIGMLIIAKSIPSTIQILLMLMFWLKKTTEIQKKIKSAKVPMPAPKILAPGIFFLSTLKVPISMVNMQNIKSHIMQKRIANSDIQSVKLSMIGTKAGMMAKSQNHFPEGLW